MTVFTLSIAFLSRGNSSHYTNIVIMMIIMIIILIQFSKVNLQNSFHKIFHKIFPVKLG